MNHEVRSELISTLTEISRVAPYYRYGQLLALVADRAEQPYANPVCEADDEELLPAARDFLDSLKALPESYLADQIRAHRESDLVRAAG